MIEVRRSDERRVTRHEGILSRHSFSFGDHYDPADVGFGPLVAHNDDLIEPGAGYEWHEHGDVVIVTWVLDGVLRHHDSLGTRRDLTPGSVAVTDASSGIRHSETNPSLGRHDRMRFVQTWLRPADTSDRPAFAAADVTADVDTGALVAVASGLSSCRGRLRLPHTRSALLVARLPVGGQVEVPAAPGLLVYVARGCVEYGPVGPLTEGDQARCRGEGVLHAQAVADRTELLVWVTEFA